MTDEQIVAAMVSLGGSFVQRLGLLYGWADAENRARIKAAWPEYWREYEELAALKAGK